MTPIRTFIFGVLITLITQPALAGKSAGVFMIVKGKIFVTKEGETKAKKARMGMKVYAKDTIEAKDNSRAKIVMVDKNVLNISPKSKIQLADYKYENGGKDKNVMINLIYGKIRSKVKQKYDGKKNTYRVKTKAAVAGVRGTDFVVSHINNQSEVITFSGEVSVGNAIAAGIITNPVSVKPGQMTSVAANASPVKPIKMAAPKLNQIDRATNAETANDKDAKAEDNSNSDEVRKNKEAEKEKKAQNKREQQEKKSNAKRPAAEGEANNNKPKRGGVKTRPAAPGMNAGIGQDGAEIDGEGDSVNNNREPAAGTFMPPPPPPINEVPIIDFDGGAHQPPIAGDFIIPDIDMGGNNPILDGIIQQQNVKVNIVIVGP